MAKLRKTRKEKIIARLRRQLMITQTGSGEYTIQKPLTSVVPSSSHKSPTYSYSFVIDDIKRTSVVTAFILIGQLLFFLFLIGRR